VTALCVLGVDKIQHCFTYLFQANPELRCAQKKLAAEVTLLVHGGDDLLSFFLLAFRWLKHFWCLENKILFFFLIFGSEYMPTTFKKLC